MDERQLDPDTACDRCGLVPLDTGLLLDRTTMAAICFRCLTYDEIERLTSGQDPFD